MMEAEIFDVDDRGFADSIEEDVEEGDGKTLDLPTAQSYSHVVAMMCIHWRETDATDCLESSVFFHL